MNRFMLRKLPTKGPDGETIQPGASPEFRGGVTPCPALQPALILWTGLNLKFAKRG